MPSPTAVIGGSFTVYLPDDTEQIALGYTGIRIYFATSETASPTLVTTLTLVDGTYDYSYNKTDAAATDWFEWCLYGATPGEGSRSERIPIGPPQNTRKTIRQGVGTRLGLMELVTATGTSATVFTAPELIDLDRSVHTVGNKWARPTSGSYTSSRRVRPGATGYSSRTTGEVTVGRTFGGTLAAATEVELWASRGERDVSAAIDEAMQRARFKLWWEETWFLTVDASISEYYAPQGMLKAGIKAVEYVTDTYPTRPGWAKVGDWDLVNDGGQPLLSISSTPGGNTTYSAGTIIRIVYNRFGDRMDSDTDYWNVPLEWAIAEVAFEYLQAQIVPNGSKEDTAGVATSAAALNAEAMGHRQSYMPSPPNPRVRVAR